MDEPDVRVTVAAFEARDDPNGSLMNMRRQIFRRPQHPLKSLPAGARSRFTSPVPWGDLFIPGALVQGPDSLFDFRIADYEEPPALHISAARRTDARFKDLSNEFIRHRVWFQTPHRPGGPNHLEQISAVDYVRHRILADYRLSRGCAIGSLSARIDRGARSVGRRCRGRSAGTC